MDKPIVSVCILTYNQEQYIRQAIESVLAQETTYPYEIIIGDDGSTDGTRKICEEYASKYDNITIAPQEHNLGVVGNYINCAKLCRGKYKMEVDGDDYWHNPHKMQIQVDFMESHTDCVVCHTDIDTLYVKTNKLEHNSKKTHNVVPPEGRIQQQVLSGKEYITSATMCIRLDAFFKYIPMDKYVELGFQREDWPTLLILSAYGDINYIPVSTATYRVGQPSITREISYDKIRKRYQQDKIMTEYLYSLFPDFGPFIDGWWYDAHTYKALLSAAYYNNDYKMAKQFASELEQTRLGANRMSKMAKCYITFKAYKFIIDFQHLLS